MNTRVIYQSTTGNTKRVADCMAAAAGCASESVTQAVINEPVDMLFLGAALHGDAIDASVKKFIEVLDPALVKKVTLFSTGYEEHKEKAVGLMRDLVSQRGIPVTDKCYFCRGKFLLWNRGRPNEDDLAEAKAFALGIVSK
ncbi:MAG: flavodoxin domain-containing protein [Candidatus Cryosericum sp.]|jgi:flavodoxin